MKIAIALVLWITLFLSACHPAKENTSVPSPKGEGTEVTITPTIPTLAPTMSPLPHESEIPEDTRTIITIPNPPEFPDHFNYGEGLVSAEELADMPYYMWVHNSNSLPGFADYVPYKWYDDALIGADVFDMQSGMDLYDSINARFTVTREPMGGYDYLTKEEYPGWFRFMFERHITRFSVDGRRVECFTMLGDYYDEDDDDYCLFEVFEGEALMFESSHYTVLTPHLQPSDIYAVPHEVLNCALYNLEETLVLNYFGNRDGAYHTFDLYSTVTGERIKQINFDTSSYRQHEDDWVSVTILFISEEYWIITVDNAAEEVAGCYYVDVATNEISFLCLVPPYYVSISPDGKYLAYPSFPTEGADPYFILEKQGYYEHGYYICEIASWKTAFYPTGHNLYPPPDDAGPYTHYTGQAEDNSILGWVNRKGLLATYGKGAE